MRRLGTVFLLIAALGLLGAGCGGDDDGGGEPLTKDEFIAQADEICQEGNDAIEEETGTLGADSSDEDIEAAITETVLPEIQEQHDQIAELTPPEGDEEQIDELLAALQEGIDAGEEDPAQVLEDSAPGFEDANRIAVEYGFEVCGEG